MIPCSSFTLTLFMFLIAYSAAASVRPLESQQIAAVERQDSSVCMNDGINCRCSKSTAPGASLCKRRVGNNQCTVGLCDEPFQCDCNGSFMCSRTSTVGYWDCDEAGSAAFRTTDSCKCSRKNRTKASYALRVTQPLAEYIRGAGDPSTGCGMSMDFWA